MKRVVVTGASSGIGAACVDVFHDLDAEVIGLDVSESSRADHHLRMDLSDPRCGHRLMEFFEAQPVDGLVNNAGIGLNKAAVVTKPEEFDFVMAVNLRAPFLLASALQPKLADSGGFVVNVASVHAWATSRFVSAYAASKGGLVALTRALAIEWGPEIRVNAVLPGAVDTPMLKDGLLRSDTTMEEMAVKHPLRRVGSADDIANAVAFLARNRFVTGSVLVVDGGATARLSTE